MPRQRRALVPPVDNEIVAFGLARNRFFDGGVQEIVALGSAERFTQVGRVFLPKAHIERAGAGDADRPGLCSDAQPGLLVRSQGNGRNVPQIELRAEPEPS